MTFSHAYAMVAELDLILARREFGRFDVRERHPSGAAISLASVDTLQEAVDVARKIHNGTFDSRDYD